MKIYDMHIHANGGSPNPSKLIENMEEAGVYGGAIFSVRPTEAYGPCKMDYEERLENLLGWTKGYEGRLFPVLWIHPREKNLDEKIRDAASRGIVAFKMICDDYNVYDDISMKAIESIEKTGKPVFFHSGILWSGKAVAANHNRPANWEILLNVPNFRFSMAHCSWPWYDECIALYGRLMAAYRIYPKDAPEMFFDLTPGTPEVYREDLMTKLFNSNYDVPHNIMFGTDMLADDYDAQGAKHWIDIDNKIYDKLGVTEEIKNLIYCDNFLRFIGVKESTHTRRSGWHISDGIN